VVLSTQPEGLAMRRLFRCRSRLGIRSRCAHDAATALARAPGLRGICKKINAEQKANSRSVSALTAKASSTKTLNRNLAPKKINLKKRAC